MSSNACEDLFIWEVLEAVMAGNMCIVKDMVNSGISVNIANKYGNTPLHVAALGDNNLRIVDYLLAQDNIAVDVRNSEGETPLYQAVHHGRFELTRRLILAGANINLANKGGVTPLHASVTYPDIAHLLILHNAHINAAIIYYGCTPLHFAIDKRCLDTVCMLLFFNADANATGYNNLTPFMRAIIARHAEIQQVLLEYVLDFNAVTADGAGTLGLALAYESPHVSEIIQRGADVNYVNTNLYGPTACAFLLSLCMPNHQNFKLIWDRLYYDDQNTNAIDLTILFDHLTRDNLEKYIDVIIESDNVHTTVASLTENRNYDRFICNFAATNLNPELLTKLTYRLIFYEYHVTNHDLNEIFNNYGYCELFKMLLYMEFNYTFLLPDMILPKLIFDPDCNLRGVDVKQIVHLNISKVPKLLQYFNHPPLMKEFRQIYRDNEEMTQIVNKLPRVPLLKEIARDMARYHIANTNKPISACKFYTIVNHLDIPSLYKKILTFERKMYIL